MALPVKALKAGQESYWLDQIARNREEYFSGRGESPGRFMGSAAAAAGMDGVASPEQVQAMFQGLDPATGEQRCARLWRADPRSKLAAGPLLEALAVPRRSRVTCARSRRPAGWAARSGSRSRRSSGCAARSWADPRELYGEAFAAAWQHRGKRVDERVQAFDHCAARIAPRRA